MDKVKVKNSSIDIFRYICAIMVVAIHTNPFADINSTLAYLFTEIIPRIGVPFFFAVSGYFYIQKLEKNEKPFFHYIKRLLTTYFIWSCLYFLIDFIKWGHSDIKGFAKNCIYSFAITGSCYHFWYFPAIVFAVCFTTLLFKIKCKKLIIPLSFILYIAGCLSCSYYELGVQIPVLGKAVSFLGATIVRRVLLMGFPFFVSGYLVYKIKDNFMKVSNKKFMYIWAASCMIWLAELAFVIKLDYKLNIIITLGLYLFLVATLLILLKNPLPKYRRIAEKSRVIANFTYYSHPFFIMAFEFLGREDIFNISITQTPMFLLTVGITFVGGLIIYKWNHKAVNYLVK